MEEQLFWDTWVYLATPSLGLITRILDRIYTSRLITRILDRIYKYIHEEIISYKSFLFEFFFSFPTMKKYIIINWGN
jgi:hypothetical protein